MNVKVGRRGVSVGLGKCRSSWESSQALGEAHRLLARARDLAVSAGAPRAAAAIRRALKSADGAHRHAVSLHLRARVY